MPKKEKRVIRVNRLVKEGVQARPAEQTAEQLKENSAGETTKLVKYTYKVLVKATHAGRNPLPFYEFVINPDRERGFGQTVENIFYTTFLIADGRVKLYHDEHGELFISTHPYEWTNQRADLVNAGQEDEFDVDEEGRQRKLGQHQDVMNLEMAQWRELIDLYDIAHSIIPNRAPQTEALKYS